MTFDPFVLVFPTLIAALDQGDYNTADRIQVGLMVDHVSEVSQWLVAVKKLIAILKSS